MDISEQVNLNQTTAAPEDIELFLDETVELVQKRRSQTRIIFDRFLRNRVAVLGLGFLIIMVFFCYLGPTVTGHNQPDLIHPIPLNAVLNGGVRPTLQYPFGTDDIGHDWLARAMVGGQISLLVGFSSMLIAIVLGIGIGSFAGFFGLRRSESAERFIAKPGWAPRLEALVRKNEVLGSLPPKRL